MDAILGLPMATTDEGVILAAVNAHLSAAGISVTREDAMALAELRVTSLAEVERVEFGRPAIVAIAEAIASSSLLTRKNASATLAELQAAFYALRDELPIDVPDDEIVEALSGCFAEWGDAAEVARMPTDELMAFSAAYRRAKEAEDTGAYRIVDDDGRAHSFDPAEWDYDETAPGWDGERWSDD